jgi:hypothetical protein
VGWNAASFKARWAEFASTPDATVEAALAEAGRRCSAAVFGDRHDDAVGLRAAHLLSVSPFGQQARLESDKAETVYMAEWRQLARECAGGPWAIGQLP